MIFFYMTKIIGQVLPINCVENGTVALTIDEGPSVYTDNILEILEKENVKATFHFNAAIRGRNLMTFMTGPSMMDMK